jgi:hypothetical protein
MAYMTAEEALEAAKGMTFEKMWALMMEDRERQAKFEKLQEERQAKLEKLQEEREAKLEKQQEEREAKLEKEREEREERQAKLEKEREEREAKLEKQQEEREAKLEKEREEREAKLEKQREEREEREEREAKLEKERRKEIDRSFAELKARVAETSARVDATTANVDKMAERVDRVTKNVGGLNQSIGELVETLIASRLWEKFPQYNFNGSSRRIELLDEHKNVLTEVDILLLNTEWTMAVEVKREPNVGDVRHHLKRMKLLRKYSYALVRGKKLVGAIAGGVVSPEVRNYAQKSGLYVLELNGEQVSLVKSPPGFVAVEC